MTYCCSDEKWDSSYTSLHKPSMFPIIESESINTNCKLWWSWFVIKVYRFPQFPDVCLMVWGIVSYWSLSIFTQYFTLHVAFSEQYYISKFYPHCPHCPQTTLIDSNKSLLYIPFLHCDTNGALLLMYIK